MKKSRRVHPFISACAGLALTACAGAVEPTFDEFAAPTDTGVTADEGAYEVASTSAELRRSRRRTSTSTQTPTTPTQPTGGTASPPPVTQPPAPTAPAANIAWTDSLQTSATAPWGFNQVQLERPIGSSVSGNNDVNLVRVTSPDGKGYAMKHTATFDAAGGSRSQAGIYSFANKTFNDLAKSPGGIYIAQEWYFPEPLYAGELNSRPWANLWDWHSVGSNGTRWDTQPGLMVAQDGSMRVKWSWRQQNQETAWSQIDLPVREWFHVEMHYVWTSTGATVSLWINGELALQQHGVKTKDSAHSTIETYMKFYGSANSGPSWSPRASVKYTRNVRMSASRIWR